MQKVIVIGAGPAGLALAYKLVQSKKFQVEVFEAANQVGGMCKSIDLWEQKVDLGPHRFFSTDTRINQFWLEIAGRDYQMVQRLTRIYYNKKFYFYPLVATNALLNLGPIEALRCVLSYAKVRLFPVKSQSDFQSWVVSRFGQRLFEIFFKSYSEKLWGIPCTELDQDFAAQRIKKLSLFEVIKKALFLPTQSHKTLVDCFAYPEGGTGAIYEKMAGKILAGGGKIHLNCPVRQVLLQNHKAIGIELLTGEKIMADHVTSSMPLTSLVQKMETPAEIQSAAKALRFRNTILVYLHVNGKNLFPDQWLYVHSKNLGFGRITNFRNWIPSLYGKSENTILALEFWCQSEDPLWTMDDLKLIERATADMQKTQLLGKAQVLDGSVLRVPKCYPIYDLGYKSKLAVVENYLRGIGSLQLIGRYGSFKYNNQDHSLLMGLLAAENLIFDSNHDLWSLNTDDEYQEASTITEAGLDTGLSAD